MTSAKTHETLHPQHLAGRQVLFLAVAAGVATSTSYTVQPELRRIAQDLDASLVLVSAAAGLPVLGYMIGLALLTPLVDHLPARRLLSAQLAVLALSLGLAAMAADVLTFGAALLVSGICASTGAQMSTLASSMRRPAGEGAPLEPSPREYRPACFSVAWWAAGWPIGWDGVRCC
jgi:predicted MFS family arabinose efflux permease